MSAPGPGVGGVQRLGITTPLAVGQDFVAGHLGRKGPGDGRTRRAQSQTEGEGGCCGRNAVPRIRPEIHGSSVQLGGGPFVVGVDLRLFRGAGSRQFSRPNEEGQDVPASNVLRGLQN